MTERQLSLGELAEAAFLAASRTVIERAKQTGTPVIIWRDEKVTAISWEEAEQELEEAIRKKAAASG